MDSKSTTKKAGIQEIISRIHELNQGETIHTVGLSTGQVLFLSEIISVNDKETSSDLEQVFDRAIFMISDTDCELKGNEKAGLWKLKRIYKAFDFIS